jgi:hypothetical protein
MSEPVNGTNVMLYYHRVSDDTDVPFACARQCVLNITPSFTNVTNQSSAWYKEVKRDISEWGVSVDGLTILSNYSYLFLTDLEQARTTILIKFVVDNGADGLVIYAGNVYPGPFTLTGNYNEASVYSVQLVGTGAYNSTGTSVTPGGVVIEGGSVTRFEATVVTSGLTFVISATIGANVITQFDRGGSNVTKIIYSGSPVGNEVKFDTVTGTFTVAVGNEWVASEEVSGNFK